MLAPNVYMDNSGLFFSNFMIKRVAVQPVFNFYIDDAKFDEKLNDLKLTRVASGSYRIKNTSGELATIDDVIKSVYSQMLASKKNGTMDKTQKKNLNKAVDRFEAWMYEKNSMMKQIGGVEKSNNGFLKFCGAMAGQKFDRYAAIQEMRETTRSLPSKESEFEVIGSMKNLKNRKIEPFTVDYRGKTPEEQEKAIWQEIQKRLDEGEHVAITYAANSAQAEALYRGYLNNTVPDIHGSNQAEVFGLLAKRIRRMKIEDRVHILPIPTCKYGLSGRVIAPKEDVEKAVKNIQEHLKGPWEILGLNNGKPTPESPLAVGGGVSGKLWKGSDQEKYFLKEINKLMPSLVSLN